MAKYFIIFAVFAFAGCATKPDLNQELINAKNAYGGYVGYAWAHDIPSLQNQVIIAPNKFATSYVTRVCK